MDLLWLCGFAFLAGLVDSVVGGGGLIQLPALLLLLPAPLAAAIPAVFGTNKLSSICGTSIAVIQYARRIAIPWRIVLPAAATAFAFAFLGARVVSLLPKDLLKPIILVLLVLVALWTYTQKNWGQLHAPKLTPRAALAFAVLVGAVIGFYDGFFGPGTGSFLIFAFIGLFGFDFLNASAGAKVVNFATNLAAVIYFAATDSIYYAYALPMGACNILGSLVGTRLAILKGNRFVRAFFLCVVAAIIARLAYDMVR